MIEGIHVGLFATQRNRGHSEGYDLPAGTRIEPDAAATYDDPTAAKSDRVFEEGWKLMGHFLDAD